MWMLLHGFTGSPQDWDRVVASASLGQTPVRPALLGHGLDWRRREIASFVAEVERIRALAATMDQPRRIAGYSLGARVALGVLASDPKLFDAAVLIGVHPGLEAQPERRIRLVQDAKHATMLRAQGLSAFVGFWEALPLFDTQRGLSRDLLSRQREVRLSHDPEGLARSLEVLGLGSMPSFRGALRATAPRIVLMVGGRDTKFHDVTVGLVETNPSLQMRVVDRAGHNLLLEAPEAVAAVMKELESPREGVRSS